MAWFMFDLPPVARIDVSPALQSVTGCKASFGSVAGYSTLLLGSVAGCLASELVVTGEEGARVHDITRRARVTLPVWVEFQFRARAAGWARIRVVLGIG